MIQNNFFSLRIFGAAMICMSMGVAGCYNDDTNPSPSVSDTSTVTASDTAMMKSAGTMDTTKTNNRMTAGTAKPDSTKRGKKGRATIMESPKMFGSMEADNTGVYSNVEVYPAFPGGNKGLQDYFDKNLTYPPDATNDGVEGTVNIMFTVDETGKLADPHVMGDQLGYGLDDEALRVVRSMPVWQPGKLKGKNVKTKFTLPVRFQLY